MSMAPPSCPARPCLLYGSQIMPGWPLWAPHSALQARGRGYLRNSLYWEPAWIRFLGARGVHRVWCSLCTRSTGSGPSTHSFPSPAWRDPCAEPGVGCEHSWPSPPKAWAHDRCKANTLPCCAITPARNYPFSMECFYILKICLQVFLDIYQKGMNIQLIHDFYFTDY